MKKFLSLSASIFITFVLMVNVAKAADLIPPTVPGNLAATVLSSTDIKLTWTASTDNVAVQGYQVFKNGVFAASTNALTFTATGLSPSTAYSFTVKAYDATPNYSAAAPAVVATTLADNAIPLSGWAWSSNIGWISFSSAQGGGGPYEVTISTSSSNPLVAKMKGYAWSEHIGWIKFDGLAGYPPSGSGTEAQINLDDSNPATYGQVTGWARACAGTLNNPPNQALPGNCSSMNPRTDGWDGWIELSGVNHVSPDPVNATSTKGVYLNPLTGYFSGYAWGGSVIGWMEFNPKMPLTGLDGGMGGKVPCGKLGTCGGGGGGGVTVSCAGVSNAVTGKITWTATANGAALYDYNWTGAWVGSDTYSDGTTYANGVVVSGPLVQARDRNDWSKSASIQCPNVTSLYNVAGMSLEVGPNLDPGNTLPHSTEATALRVKVNSTFVLRWVNTLPIWDGSTGYFCTATPNDPPYRTNNDFAVWTNPLSTDVNSSGNLPDLKTNKTGVYSFKISCVNQLNANDKQERVSFIRVRNTTEGEI